MKKFIALAFVTICALGLVGCADDSEQGKENKTENTQTFAAIENSVGEINRETFDFPVEITEEDATALSEIINSGTWIDKPTECESDCEINLKGHWAYYNSENGILNVYNLKDMSIYSSKELEVTGKSLILSEKDKTTVNAILEKYVTLGFVSD